MFKSLKYDGAFSTISGSLARRTGAYQSFANMRIFGNMSPCVKYSVIFTLVLVGIILAVTLIGGNQNCGAESSLKVNSGLINWTAYHRLDTIYDWLDKQAETHPQWVKVLNIGNSYEGRKIKGVSIIFNETNPGVFVEGGTHAREWISPATVTYLINEILSGKNESFNAVARAHNWYIITNANPDGYEYSHTTDRLWRKSRRPYTDECVGVDMNRNWDFYWMKNGGASQDPCSSSYAGPKAFSEIETKALVDYISSVADKFYIYLSMHSYGQKILLPYGYTNEHLANYNESMAVATAAAKALALRYGTQYEVGTSADIEYIDTGTSKDYMKGVIGTRFSYTYELRDSEDGPDGFVLPAEQIIPTAIETMDSFTALLNEALKRLKESNRTDN